MWSGAKTKTKYKQNIWSQQEEKQLFTRIYQVLPLQHFAQCQTLCLPLKHPLNTKTLVFLQNRLRETPTREQKLVWLISRTSHMDALCCLV